LRASSHDAWIKFYRPDENSRNSRISYYTKGAVVAFLLDAHIRQATNDSQSLDDVMRLLYQRHSNDRGYTPDDFRAIAAEVAGRDLSDWFRRAVDSSDELEYQAALNWFGLQFGQPEASEAEDHQDAPDQEKDEAKVWLGIKTQNKQGRLVVTHVRRGSPAFHGGVNADDEILAMGEFRVTPSQWETRLKQYQPGDVETLLIARRERLRRIRLTFDQQPPDRQWQLSVVDGASADQTRHLRGWLGIDEPPASE
jgi:predicted metalloprotease with PDZ domain